MSNTESLIFFFKTKYFNIFTYIDCCVMNFLTYIYFFCPILCTRPIACISTAGFHQGSMKNILFAVYKFKPTEPVFKVITRTLTDKS